MEKAVYSTKEAAELLGCSQRAVNELVILQKLKKVPIGTKKYMIAKQSLDDYLKGE